MIWVSEHCALKWLLISALTMVPVVMAAAEPAGLALSSPPLTMARFYIVDSGGRSVSDEDIPTQANLNNQRSVETRRKKSYRQQQSLASKAREPSDSWRMKLVTLNETKAWQCERHGHFFTADGRCIRPILHVKSVPPRAISRRPFRRNLASK
jgi:hypothetical protein